MKLEFFHHFDTHCHFAFSQMFLAHRIAELYKNNVDQPEPDIHCHFALSQMFFALRIAELYKNIPPEPDIHCHPVEPARQMPSSVPALWSESFEISNRQLQL